VGTLVLSGVTASGQNAYVARTSDDTVSVINTSSNTVIATIPVGDRPRGVAMALGGGSVLGT